MTNNRTIEGRAKVCERSEHRATLRPRGRRRSELANLDFFDLIDDSANRELANRHRQIMCWQIMSRQIALWQIAMHPKNKREIMPKKTH